MRYADCQSLFSLLPVLKGLLPRGFVVCRTMAPASLLAALLLAACENSEPPPPNAEPPSVIAEPAKIETVEDESSFVGRIVAINKVELMARVEGFLKERKFTEGDKVEQDQVLFLIEPDQYQAQVEQQQADLASAQASELNASAQLKRGRELLKDKNIAQSQVDELQAAESVALANIQQAQAALNAALLNLSYTQITAPVAGRVGLANFTIGNLVGPTSGTLATLVSRDPIYVRFPVTQRELLEARREIETRGGNARDVQVYINLPDDTRYSHTGRLDFVDVTTDQATDSITLRAEVANPEGLLIDGQFVNLGLVLGDPEEAVMIPQSALQVDQQGVYILIVDKNNKAEVRRVQTGPTDGGNVAITQGLKEGELVITEGIQKVRPGQEVKASPPQQVTGSGADDAPSHDGQISADPPAESPAHGENKSSDSVKSETSTGTLSNDNAAGAEEAGTQKRNSDSAGADVGKSGSVPAAEPEVEQNSEANAL